MVATSSNRILTIGSPAPDFTLEAVNEFGTVQLSRLKARGILIAFICNHCPYVKHIAPRLASLAKEIKEDKIETLAICSNDVENHPEDSPSKMAEEAASRGYSFPYLFDESQEVATIFGAACTPDFFLLDQDQKVYYHGQFDSSRPLDKDAVASGEEIKKSIENLLQGRPAATENLPSIGCSIKWKKGNQPSYSISS